MSGLGLREAAFCLGSGQVGLAEVERRDLEGRMGQVARGLDVWRNLVWVLELGEQLEHVGWGAGLVGRTL